MSRTGRSMIRFVLTAKDLESFVETYRIPERFSPTLLGPDDSAECTPDQIVLCTLSFSSCGVRYPLSTFKTDLLRHFKVHFFQLHPLGFMRVGILSFYVWRFLMGIGLPFAKRKDSVSQPCYYKEWKSRFIFVSAAMIPESLPLRDAKAAIEDNVPILSTDEIVQWKRMYENPTRAFTFPEGILAMGGLSPLYSVRPKVFFGKKGISLFLVCCVGGSATEEKDEEASPGEKKGPLGSLQVRSSSDEDNDEDLESRLVCKRKAGQPGGPKQVPVPRDIRLRLQSASGQKAFPATKAASELPPTGIKGSLSKHFRPSSLVSEPLLGSSTAPIEIPTAPSSYRVRDKTPEVSATRITPAFEVSPLHATRTSKPSHQEGFLSRSPLAPLFADALPVPYITKWKITNSSLVGTPETARDFLAHVVPPSYRFMNSALRADLFDDQYSMSLWRENEGLRSDLQTSQTVAAELRCRVVDVERKLQEEKGAGAMLEQKERAWAREMAALVEEKEELAADLKHQKELDSVSWEQFYTMYAEWGVTSDDNQKLAKEKYWLITEGFWSFVTAISQSEEFKSSLEQIYRAYRDVGYQAGLKDGNAYSAQGLGRKETPLYNSKAKTRLSKLDKEFGGKTPALLEKILERPMISIDELKALLTPAGPSSPKSLSGDDS
ncbi:hypothetical protein Hdeb2414_s0013g00406411 [Helianthus debilis subsp. tardiflorus]